MMVSDTTASGPKAGRYDASEHQDSLESSQSSFEYSQDSLGSQKSGYLSENSSSGVESDDYVSVGQVQAQLAAARPVTVTVRKPASVVISGIRLDHRSYQESLQLPPSPQITLLYPNASPATSLHATIAEDDESFGGDGVAAASSPVPGTKAGGQVALECRSYFQQRRKRIKEWADKWSEHDDTHTALASTSALADKLRFLRGEMRELMEQDESLLETLLGLHESIENLKARRQKDPVRSGRGRTNRDPDEDVDLDFDQDHDDAARPVMTPTMDDHFSDDVDDHCEDSRLWPAYDNDDSASVCSASLALSGNEQDDDNVDKPEFRGYYSRGFVRQRVSYPPIARNRVSNAGSPEKARLSTDEGDKTSTPKNPPFEDAGEDALPFPDQLPTPTPMDKKRHEVFV